MKYEVSNGRITTRSLEVHVTDHCNLRCRQCCTLSPFLEPWCLDPERLRQDLLLARRVLAPTFFKLVGGEPLLHPRLMDCLRVAHECRIAPIISVTTNGLLLPRMPNEFWQLLHHMTLSLYPQPRLPAAHLAHIQERAETFGVTLNLKRQEQFQEMTLDAPRDDDNETQRVWQECWLRHRCHLLREGWFYLCTRPPHFDSYFHGTTDFAHTDGVRLHDGPSLVKELLAYLHQEEPLASCKLCWGGSGALFPHRQLTSLEILSRREGPP